MIILLHRRLGFATETKWNFVLTENNVSKFDIREIKTTAKGPHQENRELLAPRN